MSITSDNLTTTRTPSGTIVAMWSEPNPPFLTFFKAHIGELTIGLALKPLKLRKLQEAHCLGRYLDFHMKRILMHNIGSDIVQSWTVRRRH